MALHSCVNRSRKQCKYSNEACSIVGNRPAHTLGADKPYCSALDITELGNIVTGAFLHADQVGNGEYLPLVGDFMSFNEIVETLNRRGHRLAVKQVPKELFATFFPGAAEIAEMFSYFQAHTYLGSDSLDQIALANKIAGRQPTRFAAWAGVNLPVPAP